MSPDCLPTVCVWFDGLTIKGSLQQSQEGNRGREREAPNVSLAIPGIIQAWRLHRADTRGRKSERASQSPELKRETEKETALNPRQKPRTYVAGNPVNPSSFKAPGGVTSLLDS